MVPGFPNLWSVYGPNTNGGLGPGAFHELVTRYALECMERLILEDKKEIEPTEEAYWRFNEDVDARNARKTWSDPRSESYYWTEHGRSVVMCPFTGSGDLEPPAPPAVRRARDPLRTDPRTGGWR